MKILQRHSQFGSDFLTGYNILVHIYIIIKMRDLWSCGGLIYSVFRFLLPTIWTIIVLVFCRGELANFTSRDEYVGACGYVVTKSTFKKLSIAGDNDHDYTSNCEVYKEGHKFTCKADFGSDRASAIKLANISTSAVQSLF